MLAIDEIENLLNELQTLYDSNTKSPTQQKYYSKLALLELCGWLESTFDDIAYEYALSNMPNSANTVDLDKKIELVYGCSYENLRTLLTLCIGLPKLLVLEEQFSRTGELVILKGDLNTLWGMRKPAAHTSLAGRTEQFQTPTVLLIRLKSIYTILTRMDSELAKL